MTLNAFENGVSWTYLGSFDGCIWMSRHEFEGELPSASSNRLKAPSYLLRELVQKLLELRVIFESNPVLPLQESRVQVSACQVSTA